MRNLRDMFEEQGLEEDKIDEIMRSVNEDNKKKVAEANNIDMENIDSLIDNEENPYKRAQLVARKISNKLDNASY